MLVYINYISCPFGVSILEGDRGAITMELEMEWDGNPNIVLAINTLVGVALPIQVKNIGFSGIFRLIFKPLVAEFPCFGAVCFSLREKVPPFLVRKVFTQTFSFINVQLFNSLLLRRECCSFSNGEYVKAGLAELEHWCYKAADERTTSSSSLASSNGNPAELRSGSSLIDFDDVPEPPSTATLQPTQVAAPGPSVAQQTTSSNDNWANFDSFSEVKASPAPSNANLFESFLSELSVPAPLSGNAAASLMSSASSPLGLPTGLMLMLFFRIW